MNCPSCDAENPPGASFCAHCGTKLAEAPPAEAPCRSCQAMLPVDARFCGFCGAPDPLAAAVVEVAPPPAERAPPVEVAPTPGSIMADAGGASALAYDHEEEDEETIIRSALPDDLLPPALAGRAPDPPGPVAPKTAPTPPTEVAASRPAPARPAPPGASRSPGAYAKQGPSLRARLGIGPPIAPPPPDLGPKPGGPKPASTMTKPASAMTKPAGPKPAGAMTKPGEPKPASAGPQPGPAAVPKAVATVTEVNPVVAAPSSEAASGSGAPEPELVGPPSARPRVARTVTEPQKAVYSSPVPSEAAMIFAAPEGWPDITDELAEIRFSSIQGFDDDTRAAVAALRERYPGHPDVESLVAELGGEPSAAPPLVPGGSSASPPPAVEPSPIPLTPVEGPPPRGRYRADGLGPGGTIPPSSARAEPPPGLAALDARDGLALPPTLVASPSPGAPMATPVETSDELLDLEIDAAEFDRLEDEDPYETEAPPSIDALDLDGGGGGPSAVPPSDVPMPSMRTSTEPAPAASSPALADEVDVEGVEEVVEVEVEEIEVVEVVEVVDDISMEIDEEPEEIEDDFVDRTMAVQGYQPPAPYDDDAPHGGLDHDDFDHDDFEPGDGVGATATDLPQMEAEPHRATLAPDAELRSPEELETTLPPGQFHLGGSARSTFAPDGDAGAPSYLEAEPTPIPPPPPRRSTLVPQLDGRGPPPYPGSPPGMTTPSRDGDVASASGEFRVSDLELDDLPVLEPGRASIPPGFATEHPDEQALTAEGTVVARAPMPPSPYGAAPVPIPVVPVRLVMLGARGDEVAERRIEVGAHFDVGRHPGEPWAEDRRMQPLHARVFPAPGGLVIDDFGAPHGVYTQIQDTIAVEDGDEFKVGQARLALQRVSGPGATWGQLTLVRHDDPTPKSFRLDRDEVIIGREEGDITLPEDTFVSGDHCRFGREGNAIYLEDLGSSNGTYVRVRAGQCVAFGGLLLIGHTQFRVCAG